MIHTSENCIAFSDIVVGTDIPLPYPTLAYSGNRTPDDTYAFVLLEKPLVPDTAPVTRQGGSEIYRTEHGRLRIYTALTAADGCQVACLFSDDGRHTMYYPASRWEFYKNPLHCAHLLCGEMLLLRHRAFLLHSSVVLYRGKTVLFSGPSGVGKSTQAALWKDVLGADILNGDRCVIMEKNGMFFGGGSIWAGTSGIYRPEQAPISGIFLLEQAETTRVTPAGAEAFAPLFSQTILNTWDSAFMETVTGLYDHLLSQVPVYRLSCRADKDAVLAAHDVLF
ncbi:MAG: hypothetical protein IJ449_11545 [Clostridia bacterium]|nr:hypothetical protein [Clostridia bacterium]